MLNSSRRERRQVESGRLPSVWDRLGHAPASQRPSRFNQESLENEASEHDDRQPTTVPECVSPSQDTGDDSSLEEGEIGIPKPKRRRLTNCSASESICKVEKGDSPRECSENGPPQLIPRDTGQTHDEDRRRFACAENNEANTAFNRSRRKHSRKKTCKSNFKHLSDSHYFRKTNEDKTVLSKGGGFSTNYKPLISSVTSDRERQQTIPEPHQYKPPADNVHVRVTSERERRHHTRASSDSRACDSYRQDHRDVVRNEKRPRQEEYAWQHHTSAVGRKSHGNRHLQLDETANRRSSAEHISRISMLGSSSSKERRNSATLPYNNNNTQTSSVRPGTKRKQTIPESHQKRSWVESMAVKSDPFVRPKNMAIQKDMGMMSSHRIYNQPQLHDKHPADNVHERVTRERERRPTRASSDSRACDSYRQEHRDTVRNGKRPRQEEYAWQHQTSAVGRKSHGNRHLQLDETTNRRGSAEHTSQISMLGTTSSKERRNSAMLPYNDTQTSSVRRGKERKQMISESHLKSSWVESMPLKSDPVVRPKNMAIEKVLDMTSSHILYNQPQLHDKHPADNVHERVTRERDRRRHTRTNSDSRECDSYRQEHRETDQNEKHPWQEEYDCQHQISTVGRNFYGNKCLQPDEVTNRMALKNYSGVRSNNMAIQKDLDIMSSHRIYNQPQLHDKHPADNVHERVVRERERRHHTRASSDSRACDSYRQDHRHTVRNEKRPQQEEYAWQHQTSAVGRKSHGNRHLQLDETTNGRSGDRTRWIARKLPHNETFQNDNTDPTEQTLAIPDSRLRQSSRRPKRRQLDITTRFQAKRTNFKSHVPRKNNFKKKYNSGLLGTISFLSRPQHHPNDIATTMANRGEELDTYLQNNENCPQIVNLVSVLSNCSKAMLCTSSKAHVMYILRKRNFFERKDIIGKLKEIRLSSSLGEDVQFLMHLVSIMETMIQTVCISQADTMIATSLIKVIIDQSDSNDEIHASLKEAFGNIAQAYSKEEHSGTTELTENLALTLPILPDIDTIRSEDHVCIPMHSIHKPFINDQHYISHMYAIFREDFVRPLTKGIKSYITHLDRRVPEQFRSQDVRFYDEVYVVYPNAHIDNGMVWTIQFPVKRRGSSMLQYGSLLCLSSDGFESIHFATVVNRDNKSFMKGQIDIKFLDTVDTTDIIGREYVMLESRAFYEAYSHVLLFMKQLAEELETGESTLPMGKYLTGQTNAVEPSVLREISLKCLKQYGDTTLKPSDSSFVIDVKSSAGWPSSSEVGLDVSQFEALKSVLTQEISLIQGPPGTGKTMMGVRIAEVFISNFHSSPFHKMPTPLLLVSYTNHALDQFLQLLLRTSTMVTILPTDIVRVGSRCKNEQIDRFSLKKHRQAADSSAYRRSSWNAKGLSRDISEIKDILSEYQQYLIHEDSLVIKSMHLQHYYQLGDRRSKTSSDGDTLFWLWLQLNSTSSREATMQEDYQEWIGIDDTTVDRTRLVDDMDDDEDRYPQVTEELTLPKRALNEDTISKQILRNISLRLSVRYHFNEEQASSIYDIWQLNIDERWALYRYWIHKATQPLELKLHGFERQFEAASRMYREAQSLLDCNIMKKASVVAMTTTAASRYTNILKEVAPSTLIIEEAAQVSEQHVLGALSPTCQRLIMIGDHQQLRPACNDYELSKTHSTDVSLFERLIRCKFPFRQLENQHRMRPEISALLVPHIYHNLNDDESVFRYPDVRGMASNVYFWTHDISEDHDDESLSHSNKHEAELLLKLYRHLRLQGYQGKDVTVLTMYSDQVKLLQDKMLSIERTDPLIMNSTAEIVDTVVGKANRCDVHITTVDNFQGEENRIILLSLVRSTKGQRIGHLAVGNRVCVSLSRAQEGLYVVGNMTCLRQASPLWDKIISKAERNGMCGEYLQLKCLKHPTHKKMIKVANDFDAVVDGGCEQPCSSRLRCGHTCSRKCHSDDPDHQFACTKMCTIVCENGHSYQMPCNKGRGKCMEDIDVELKCGHAAKVKCSTDITSVECRERCTEKVSCGHTCQKRCSEVCTTEQNCNELVKVTGRCQHTYQIACYKKTSEECSVKCDTILVCGHPCTGKCGLCHQGRLHMPCRKRCDRRLVCGHDCKAFCTDVCPPCIQKCAVKCRHSRCDNKCADVCIPCKENCQWSCRRNCKNKYVCTKLCSEDCNRPRCNIPCRSIMPCGHKCIALQCEKCFCKECNPETEFEIFFGTEDDPEAVFYMMPDCGHIFEVTSLDKYLDDVSVGSVGKMTCPKCKTPLTDLPRYGNIIRQCFWDIAAVKTKLLSNDLDLKKKQSDLLVDVSRMNVTEDYHRDFFQLNISSARNMAHLSALINQMTFYNNVVRTIEKVDVLISNKYLNQDKGQRLKVDLGKLQQWVLNKRFRFSDQEMDEFEMELTRLRFCIRMLVVQETVQKKVEVPDADNQKVNEALTRLSNGSKLLKKEVDTFEETLKDLETRHPSTGLGITEDERIMIVKAMNFSQKGHWYKCKNGHVYTITECGGAMQEAKCPECSEDIGGSHHKLKEDNSLASEMDGARYSAWSEMANMHNFNLNDDELI